MNIEFQNASRAFNGRWAIRELTTGIQPGSIVAVLGANGAGKSTMLRLLAGWIPLTDGKICVDDSPILPTATRLRRRIMLLDDSARSDSVPAKKLGQLIKDYAADRPGIEDEVADWFDALDVAKVYMNRAGKMSKGQSYKMSLIAMFVIRPEVWLLDEPFSAGLDANGLATLEEQIRLHRESGGTIMFSSQWPDHARRLADRAIVLDEGRLVWESEPTSDIPKELLLTASAALRAVLQGLGSAHES